MIGQFGCLFHLKITFVPSRGWHKDTLAGIADKVRKGKECLILDAHGHNIWVYSAEDRSLNFNRQMNRNSFDPVAILPELGNGAAFLKPCKMAVFNECGTSLDILIDFPVAGSKCELAVVY
jgi:hypothetical protein